MAGPVTRNAFKGYTYQEYVLIYCVSLMDITRELSEIEAESYVPHNFDDIYIRKIGEDKKIALQVKDYPNTKLSDIHIDTNEQFVSIKGNKSKYIEDNINVIIINTENFFELDSEILSLKAAKRENIYIIPLTTKSLNAKIPAMFKKIERADQILHFMLSKISDAKFLITLEDLPSFTFLKTELNNQTIMIHNIDDTVISNEITLITGAPGVGKSHYASELVKKYDTAILYRFWRGSDDDSYNQRLSFDNFLSELGLYIFESSKNFEEVELIDKILDEKRLLVIDGLDHVYNYRPNEFQQYIDFINQLQGNPTIILSRPLPNTYNWKVVELPFWTKEESREYLKSAYKMNDDVSNEIYKRTNGYPLLTYYEAEYFNIHKSLNEKLKYEDLDDYYNQLLENAGTRNNLAIYTLTTSYLTSTDFDKTINVYSREIIIEFVEKYPYLFTITLNRISLFHDSFNTFLREKIAFNSDILHTPQKNIIDSIKNKELRFLPRIGHLTFLEEKDIVDIIRLYSDIDSFHHLIQNNFDFESIIEFYTQLKIMLEARTKILNLHQYYSFILIHILIMRCSHIYQDELQEVVYLHLLNLIRNQDQQPIQDLIYSNGIYWYYYKSIVNDTITPYKYDKKNLPSFIPFNPQNITLSYLKTKTDNYFNIFKPNYDIDKILDSLNIYDDITKYEVLVDIFCYAYIHKITKYNLFSIVDNFINNININKNIELANNFIKKHTEITYWPDYLPQKIVAKLKSINIIEDLNEIKDLHNYIISHKDLDFDEISTIATDYLRYALYKNTDRVINPFSELFFKYYTYKDISLIALPEALVTFEKHGLYESSVSIKLLSYIIDISSHQIIGFMANYINLHEDGFIKYLLELNFFQDSKNIYIVFQLEIPKINLLPNELIEIATKILANQNRLIGDIELSRIENALCSIHKDTVIQILKKCNITIRLKNSQKLNFNDLDKYIRNQKKQSEKNSSLKYSAFDNDTISLNDIPYIRENQLDCIDIAGYTDGYHHCFSLLDIYDHYQKEELREKLLDIIHSAMYPHSKFDVHYEDWFYFLGNLPYFLDKIDYATNWDDMANIFKQFIDLSLIAHHL